MSEIIHELEIRAEYLKDIVEGETIPGNIIIRNISKEKSLSFQTRAQARFSVLENIKHDIYLEVPALDPEQRVKIEFGIEILSHGYLGMLVENVGFARNNHRMTFVNEKGESFVRNESFSRYRIKGIDEQLQEKLIDTLERSIKSQDALTNIQTWLTGIGVIIALFQFVGMFVTANGG